MEKLNYLLELGLREYEAKALLVLFRRSATARELSEFTGIPPTKIYQVMNRLQENGFVEVEEAEPKVYRKASARRTINELVKRRKKKLENLLDGKEPFVSALEEAELNRKGRVKNGHLLKRKVSVGGDTHGE